MERWSGSLSSATSVQQKPSGHDLLYGQQHIFDDLTTPEIALAGGVGAGKTVLLCLLLHRKALLIPDGIQWFCSHTHQLVTTVCFKTYEQLLKNWGYVKGQHYQSKANNYIRYPNGHEIFFYSATAWEKWVGASLVGAAWDEPGRIDHEGPYNEIVERLRGPELPRGLVRQLYFGGTPQGQTPYMDRFGGPEMRGCGITYNFDGVVKDLIKVSEDGRRKVLHFPTFFNHKIDADTYLDNLLSQYGHDEALVKAHIFGEFIPLFSHNCYAMTDANVIDCAPNEDLPTVYISFDFNVGQMAFTCWQQAEGKSYCVAEAPPRCENTDQACDALLRLFPPKMWKDKEFIIVGDASGWARDTRSYVSDYEIIRQRLAGSYRRVSIHTPKGNGSVRLRIQATNRALSPNPHEGRPPMVYFDRQCTRTIASMYRTTYDEKGGISKPSGDDITHPSDTVGYYIEYAHPFRHVGSLGVSY